MTGFSASFHPSFSCTDEWDYRSIDRFKHARRCNPLDADPGSTGNYVLFRRSAVTLYLSGHLPKAPDGTLTTGKASGLSAGRMRTCPRHLLFHAEKTVSCDKARVHSGVVQGGGGRQDVHARRASMGVLEVDTRVMYHDTRAWGLSRATAETKPTVY